MTHLVPCPGCNRHVRQSESACPFCSAALALSGVPAPPLPRARLGRAATFAFGATLAGAAALVGCGSDDEGKEGGGGTSAGGTASQSGSSSGGSSAGGMASQSGSSSGGSSAGMATGGTVTVGPVYGAPAAGTGGDVSSAGTSNMGGGSMALYGAPPMMGGSEHGSAGTASGGPNAFPVYGAPPAAD